MASDVSALPLTWCDQSSSWDHFGNLFLAYLAQSGSVIVALSTNGGASFSLLYESADLGDQPTVTTGAGGSYAPGSVWITYHDTTTGYLAAQGAAVEGVRCRGSLWRAPVHSTAGSTSCTPTAPL